MENTISFKGTIVVTIDLLKKKKWGVGVELLSSRALFQVCPHILSLFMIPANVANWLEKLQWGFSLVGLGEERRVQLIDWKQVTLPVRTGF